LGWLSQTYNNASYIGWAGQNLIKDVFNAYSQQGFSAAWDKAAEATKNISREIDGREYAKRGESLVASRQNELSENRDGDKYSFALDFNEIIESGQAGFGQSFLEPITFDLEADDSFARAMKEIKQNTFERIENSPELQALLEKKEWTREDRMNWEEGVSEIVSEEVDKIPGLGDYRTPGADNIAIKPTTHLNRLSEDIDNAGSGAPTPLKNEFDCDIIALVEGITLQQAENKFLPKEGAGDYKQATSYKWSIGDVDYGGTVVDATQCMPNGGRHGFIISPATAAIIEATSDPSEGYRAYQRPQEGYSYADFVEGKPFASADGKVYAGSLGGVDAVLARNGGSFETFKEQGLFKPAEMINVAPPPAQDIGTPADQDFDKALMEAQVDTKLNLLAFDFLDKDPQYKAYQELLEAGQTQGYASYMQDSVQQMRGEIPHLDRMETIGSSTFSAWQKALDAAGNDPEKLKLFQKEMNENLSKLEQRQDLIVDPGNLSENPADPEATNNARAATGIAQLKEHFNEEVKRALPQEPEQALKTQQPQASMGPEG
jgi:hypothetical protein